MKNFSHTKIIIALDYSNERDALQFIKKLDPKIYKIKIGKEMFLLSGKVFVEKIIKLGFKVFLDLKLHDIPNTVSKAIISLSTLNLWMISIHVTGGREMMESAKSSLSYFKINKPFLVGVTVLSSLSKLDIKELGFSRTIDETVLLLSKLSKKVGLDGVVCPGNSVNYIKKSIKDNLKIITPGIRMQGSFSHDQKNIITPEQAINYNIDYIILGRTITFSKNPIKILEKISSLIFS
ncbi:orotidine-5'-phosphate decarboxylase [Buchnera aphidicola]|uniref:orotidine-5'-phosphate decarboxylase n=1 Tax=Buchnera aphidicola TaxID=9 RepID=UPI003464BCBA